MQSEESLSAGQAPPRSRLYHFAPIGVGTSLVESLSSYVRRLAWAYRIAPQVLMMQEILPNFKGSYSFRHFQVSPEKSRTFCRRMAIAINSAGDIAVDCADTLNRLTMRNDLHHLTLLPWAYVLREVALLRLAPGWCSACYQEWWEKSLPIYQPLAWMIKELEICPKHKILLKEHCANCLQAQDVISIAKPGYCTRCRTWLGKELDSWDFLGLGESKDKQEWNLRVVEEFIQVSTYELIPWERLLYGLVACVQSVRRFGTFTHLSHVLHDILLTSLTWGIIPSFPSLLEFSYIVNLSPSR